MREPLIITIEKGMDAGKVFRITPMAARPGHRWASRVIFALMNAGVEIPENIADAGMAAIAVIGIKALGKVPFEVAEPLLDELLDQVSIIPDPSKPEIVRKWIDEDFEEAGTIFRLQKESLMVNIDFFMSAVR